MGGQEAHLVFVQVDKREQLGAERYRLLVYVVERPLEVAVGLDAQLPLIGGCLGWVAVVLGLALLRANSVQKALSRRSPVSDCVSLTG